MGMKHNEAFEKAYWKIFEEVFGKQNSAVVKALLLAKNETADTGGEELDRVCFGLRQSMRCLAEAIERKAVSAAHSHRNGRDHDAAWPAAPRTSRRGSA